MTHEEQEYFDYMARLGFLRNLFMQLAEKNLHTHFYTLNGVDVIAHVRVWNDDDANKMQAIYDDIKWMNENRGNYEI